MQTLTDTKDAWKSENNLRKLLFTKGTKENKHFKTMTKGRKPATRDSHVLTYIGLQFNPDKYVFHLLLVLTLMFMVLYTIGTSVPAWYVLEERVSNISTCQSADHYIGPHVRRYWNQGTTNLLLTSSLWFINIRLTNDEDQFNNFVPFIFARTEHLAVEGRNGMYKRRRGAYVATPV